MTRRTPSPTGPSGPVFYTVVTMALAGFGLFFDNYDSATTTQRANDNRSESVRESKLPSSERVAQRQRESRAADAPRMAANARKRPS